MSKTITIVVTCTKRKSTPPTSACMVRSLPEATIEERAKEWIRRLKRDTSAPIAARDLYAGDHWQVAQSLEDAAAEAGYTPSLWVCSAGYGLVSFATRLKPYSATFSSSHPDAVSRNVSAGGEGCSSAASRWWELLSRWREGNRGGPRSIAELAEDYKRSATWVVASAVYLRAIAEDIRTARDRLKTPERLLIFSAGSDTVPGLNDHLLPCDSRFQPLVGGARRSLNVRLARHALRGLAKDDGDSDKVRDWFRRLLAQQPQLPRSNRVSADDQEIKDFIRTALRSNQTARFSPLLRDLRSGGTACEQKRFAGLFQAVLGEFR